MMLIFFIIRYVQYVVKYQTFGNYQAHSYTVQLYMSATKLHKRQVSRAAENPKMTPKQ